MSTSTSVKLRTGHAYTISLLISSAPCVQAELAEVDLRRVTELKPPDTSGPAEGQCTFQIMMEERVYHLRAETAAEAESWIQALRHTQVYRV